MTDLGATRGLQPLVTLRDLRVNRGWSLRELERRSGISRGTLSRFERGLQAPQRHELRLVESALRLEAGSLRPGILLLFEEDGSC